MKGKQHEGEEVAGPGWCVSVKGESCKSVNAAMGVFNSEPEDNRLPIVFWMHYTLLHSLHHKGCVNTKEDAVPSEEEAFWAAGCVGCVTPKPHSRKRAKNLKVTQHAVPPSAPPNKPDEARKLQQKLFNVMWEKVEQTEDEGNKGKKRNNEYFDLWEVAARQANIMLIGSDQDTRRLRPRGKKQQIEPEL